MTASRSRSTILLTGFDPFDGAASNPSRDAAHALHARDGKATLAMLTQFGQFFRASREIGWRRRQLVYGLIS